MRVKIRLNKYLSKEAQCGGTTMKTHYMNACLRILCFGKGVFALVVMWFEIFYV